uniref:(California timema) hypothetical protein n=1 Tax=Timema californicum TaxID=61474 RepID=A0A7R9P3G0_TIMCA|nr:unnamed protein product [Timema californicum]
MRSQYMPRCNWQPSMHVSRSTYDFHIISPSPTLFVAPKFNHDYVHSSALDFVTTKADMQPKMYVNMGATSQHAVMQPGLQGAMMAPVEAPAMNKAQSLRGINLIMPSTSPSVVPPENQGLVGKVDTPPATPRSSATPSPGQDSAHSDQASEGVTEIVSTAVAVKEAGRLRNFLVNDDSVAIMVEPFLIQFQSDAPLAPFLYEALISLMKSLMKRFVKSDKLDSARSLLELGIFNETNLLNAKYVDLGYATREAIRKTKGVSEKEILLFRQDCKTCLQKLCAKLLERSPLKYKLTKAISFLDPAVAVLKSTRSERLKSTLEIVLANNWITGVAADLVDRQFNIKAIGGIEKVDITKSLIHSVRNARSRYKDSLEQKMKDKQNGEKQEGDRKRAAVRIAAESDNTSGRTSVTSVENMPVRPTTKLTELNPKVQTGTKPSKQKVLSATPGQPMAEASTVSSGALGKKQSVAARLENVELQSQVEGRQTVYAASSTTGEFAEKNMTSPRPTAASVMAKPAPLMALLLAKPQSQTIKTAAPSSKTKSNNYIKLMNELRKKFPTKTEDVLSECISEVRKRNNNTLTGLFMPFIINQVEQELTKRKEGTGAMGLEKFGNSAWRTQPDNTVKWDKPQDKDTPEEDCIICMESLGSDQQSSLHCKHTFHTQSSDLWSSVQSPALPDFSVKQWVWNGVKLSHCFNKVCAMAPLGGTHSSLDSANTDSRESETLFNAPLTS